MARRAPAPAVARRTSPRRAKMLADSDGEAGFGMTNDTASGLPRTSEAQAYGAASSLLANEPPSLGLHRSDSTASIQSASFGQASGAHAAHSIAQESPYGAWSHSQADSIDTDSLFNGSNGSAASSENLLFRSAAEAKAKVSHARKREAGHIPRPRNAFILFRSHAVKQNLIPKTVEKDHRNISRIVSHMWKSLEPYERGVWEQEAAKEKEEHKRLYPDYRYQPVFHRERVVRRNLKQEPDAEENCEEIADKILKLHGRDGVVKAASSGPKRTTKSRTARGSTASTSRSLARTPSSTRSSSVESLAQSLGRPSTGQGGIGDSSNESAWPAGLDNDECVETVLDTPGTRFPGWRAGVDDGGASDGASSRTTSRAPGLSSRSTTRKVPAPLSFDALANSSFMDEPSPVDPTLETAAAAAAMDAQANGYLFREHMELMEQLQGHPDGPDGVLPPIPRPLSAQGATPHATSFRAAAAAGIHWTGGDRATIVSPQRAMFGEGRSGNGAAWHSWSRLAAADVSLPVLRPRNSVSGPSFDPLRRMSQGAPSFPPLGAMASSAPNSDGPALWTTQAPHGSVPFASGAWEGEWEEMANLDPPTTARRTSHSNIFAWSVPDLHHAEPRDTYPESAESSVGAPSSYAASIRLPTASEAAYMPHSEEVEMLDDVRVAGGDDARRRSIVGLKMALSAAAHQGVESQRVAEADAEAVRDLSMQLLRKWRESFSLGACANNSAPSPGGSSQHSEGQLLAASAPPSSFPTPDPDAISSFVSSLEAERLAPSPQPHQAPSATMTGSVEAPQLFLDGEHPFAARSVSPRGKTGHTTEAGPSGPATGSRSDAAAAAAAPLPWAFATDDAKVGHPVDLDLLDAAFAELLDEPIFAPNQQG